LESRLLSDLQQAMLQPGVIDYTLREFERQLHTALSETTQERKRAGERKHRLEEELGRLTSAVAETGHSSYLLRAIAEREQELAELESTITPNPANTADSREELYQFAIERLSTLPDLLAGDVPRARTELSRHVAHITMTPAESETGRHYLCEGQWNLIGSPAWAGDVRMVAGGGFEPPTFGL